MGKSSKKNVARIQKEAVWFIKFTPSQARAVWEIFGTGHEFCHQITREDFIKAATKGHLKIEQHLEINDKKNGNMIKGWINIYVWESGYENLGKYHNQPKGASMFGTRILHLTQHPFYTNSDILNQPEVFKGWPKRSKDVVFADVKGLSHVTWFEKMLNLVVEE